MLRSVVILVVGLSFALVSGRAEPFAFGVAELVEPALTTRGSVLLAAPAAEVAWTASSDAGWLQLQTTNGTGNALVRYSVEANPDRRPRSARITVNGVTMTVTQAGAVYVPARPRTTLVSQGLQSLSVYGLAVDGLGNVFAADGGDHTIKKWTAATGELTTVVADGLLAPTGLAVNVAGEVAFADWDAQRVAVWNPITKTVRTLLAGPNVFPTDVAFARNGRLLVADLGEHHDIRSLDPDDGVATVVFVEGVSWPQGLAVDACGELYVADQNSNDWGVIRYSPGTGLASPVVHSSRAVGVGVDGAGNVYFTEATGTSSYPSMVLSKWSAATGLTEALETWSNRNISLAVDAHGNLFVGETTPSRLLAIPNSWVDPSPRFVGVTAGTDTLPPVLPASTKLDGVFAPTSDQPWLTVESVAGGVVRYAFAANTTGLDRVAHISLLGNSIPVQQSAGMVALGARAAVVGPEATHGSVLVDATAPTTKWTASSDVGWLHLPAQGGAGDAVFHYSCDLNPSLEPRVGRIRIGGTEHVVTQAGAGYVAVEQSFKLPFAGLGAPKGVAVDADGNVVVADYQNNQIKKWWVRTCTTSTLVATGIDGPAGVAVDASGNVVFADARHNAVKRWREAGGSVETLVGEGLARPDGVACAPGGDVLIADAEHNAIKRWPAGGGAPVTLVGTGLNVPGGVAVDLLGNISIGDSLNSVVKRLWASDGTMEILSALGGHGVAADGYGDVLIGSGETVVRWSEADATLTPVAAVAGDRLSYVASDLAGNVYFTASNAQAVFEKPHAFVDTTPRLQGSGGQILWSFEPVLSLTPNLTGAFMPTSDQPWLVVSRVEGGRIYYYTHHNTGGVRTAHLTVLGRQIEVTQHSSTSWTFAAFQQHFFSAEERAEPAISGPTADPGGRGICNILAYACGIDPWHPPADGVMRVSTVDGVGYSTADEHGVWSYVFLNAVPEVTIRRSRYTVGLELLVEGSSDLVNWKALQPQPYQTEIDSMREETSYREPEQAGAGRRFYRVRLTWR